MSFGRTDGRFFGPGRHVRDGRVSLCGETVTIELDVGGGAHQEYVQDCEVCCRPWQVEVRYTGHAAEVTVTDESG